ncbi:hypothetical protein D4764_02G0006280 [Takifugu flavidus]|uniref:Uncharacterized protein n=1 Tax=Takifugu flavidus TaxID=433684 RepID=A0A5C6NPL7_9TELE|nr:hypothetical protein D4764_02G0006280 [Takifugu flavidus]
MKGLPSNQLIRAALRPVVMSVGAGDGEDPDGGYVRHCNTGGSRWSCGRGLGELRLCRGQSPHQSGPRRLTSLPGYSSSDRK